MATDISILTDPKWGNMPTLERLKLMNTSEAPKPGTIVPCLLCGKPFLMRPYSGYPDQSCSDCYKTYSECARIVCNVCGVTIAKVKPQITDSGYYIKPRSVLHSDCCNICNPGLHKSTIIEIQRWERSVRPKKIIIPSTKDIKDYGKNY